MKIFKKQFRKNVSIHDDVASITTEGDDKQSFRFHLASVLRIDAIRRDLITEDTIGFRFWLTDLSYEIYEDT